MKAVIIDDHTYCCDDLRKRLATYGIEVAGEAYNGFDGLNLMDNLRPDVVFLDVELPDISGIDFLARSSYLQDSDCRVVIYTAYDKYALQALRQHADDILLKPIEDNDLSRVVDRLRKSPDGKSGRLPQARPDKPDKDRFVLFTNSVDFTIISKDDIGLFQYDPGTRTWSAVVAGIEAPVRLRSKIRAKDILRFGKEFVQIHQKFIINIDCLINVVDDVCYFFPPFERVNHVIVGRVYKAKLLSRFLNF